MSVPDGYRNSAHELGQAATGSAAEKGKPLFAGEWIAFSEFDRVALAQLVRRTSGCCMAEVGSWLGTGSTQIFLQELGPFAGAELVCVDTWRGSPNVQRHLEAVAQYDLFGTFLHNVARSGSATKMTPKQMDSVAAAAAFDDRSFDVVFIDADHSYEAAKADISAWRSKVKPGGILCGHDCELRATAANRDILLANGANDVCEMDGGAFRHFHPGVILAVTEAFGETVQLWAETVLNLADGTPGRSSVWWILLP